MRLRDNRKVLTVATRGSPVSQHNPLNSKNTPGGILPGFFLWPWVDGLCAGRLNLVNGRLEALEACPTLHPSEAGGRYG